MNEIIDRISKNLKLTLESFGIIGIELTKIVAYWVIVWADTKEIYEIFKNYIKKFKELIWK
jgi:hypothetical protein